MTLMHLDKNIINELKNDFNDVSRFQNVDGTLQISFFLMHSIRDRLRFSIKSGSGVPGPEIAPRGTKSTSFAKGFFQASNLPEYLPKRVSESLRVLECFRIIDSFRTFQNFRVSESFNIS